MSWVLKRIGPGSEAARFFSNAEKEKQDEVRRHEQIGRLVFRNIDAVNTEYAAAYLLGLPESPIEEIIMENVKVRFKDDAGSGQPAMSSGVPDCSKAGIYAENVRNLSINDVDIQGQNGEMLIGKGIKNT